jgi:hypothetical protein
MSDLYCTVERRRREVRSAPLFGLDYVEISTDDQRGLDVFFLGKAPSGIQQSNVQISGGRRIRDIHVTSMRVQRRQDPALDDFLELRVNQAGDFSDYTLSLVKVDQQGRPTREPMDGFDPLYSSVVFNFKSGCPTDLDCKTTPICPATELPQPDINYLAKDYASFRQLILDRLALTMPQWQEAHVPDIGIMLVELLAYAGDYLSYYQDAVATEAYLGTARQRISVRRHARLVDYRMHEGTNARVWVTIHTDEDGPLDPRQIYFTTHVPGKPDQRVFQATELQLVPPGSYETFEPLVADPTKPIAVYASHSEMHLYTWGDLACCLPTGATSATLVDQWVPVADGGDGGETPGAGGAAEGGETPAPRAAAEGDGPPGTRRALQLAEGDILIFEEVIGPGTGNPADADPTHRQAVRLTRVTPSTDPLFHPYGAEFGQPVVEIEWCAEDALTFSLCISAQMPAPGCEYKTNISVVRGNVILVDHGARTTETPLGTVPTESTSERCAAGCEPRHTEIAPGRFCPTLKGRSLTFSQPLAPCGCADTALSQDPRQALPWVSLTGVRATPHGDVVTSWSPKADLLESGPADANFVLEVENDGHAHLRFGDGDLGRMPDAGTVFDATYRVGNGSAGNVGAETITCLVFRQTTGNAGAIAPRNPLPATGGTDPEPVEEVKLFAPSAFRRILGRAITADDYATLAADNSRRFAERPVLIAQALAEPPPQPVAPDQRASVEEEAGEEPTVGPDTCTARFRTLQGAKARVRWTGSWNQVLVAVDPLGSEEADPELLAEIGAYLEPYRRIGQDVSVQPAQYVGLDLGLDVCVLREYLRGHVEAALLDVFSTRTLPDGSRGFFHPDNLTFGEGIHVSQIIAAARTVTGVEDVRVTRLERYEIGEPPPGQEGGADELPPHGLLTLAPFEIPRLDDDPDYPENGRLTLLLRGGR